MYTPLLIVGAGPFGLALSAYAKHLGVEHVMLGVPMGFWRDRMPVGMMLRSDCEWHLDPLEELTIHAFLETRGETPDSVEPLTLEFYVEYADWFATARDLESHPGLVRSLDRSGISGRFSALLDTGDTVTADAVVIAPGFGSFAHIPDELAAILPEDGFSHTSTAVDFSNVAGDRVVIVGGRQSAFEWAALIAEAGAEAVDLVYRHDTPSFEESDWSWVSALMDATVEDPTWYRGLSRAEQTDIENRLWSEGRLKLEPWLAERVERDGVTLRSGRTLAHTGPGEEREIACRLDDGTVLQADRVILATGYRPDIRRLPYLTDALLREIEAEEGIPHLDESFQTSAPGLYITSMPAVRDFGPFMSFTVAARASARIIGNALAAKGFPG
ncbi:MAG: FAD-dependent oxidoreductase [Gemmatimonadota bacterium]|nr:FAD-dependent oxidoreductase [Gemmatimonadota bacterium]